MKIFTRQLRTLLIAVVVAVGAVGLAGCGDDNGANSGGGGGGGGTTGVVDPNTVVKGMFTDNRDGQTYKTVKIGEQTWMAENLNAETADSWCYENRADSCAKYGRLYTWAAAKSACQSVGWRLPTRGDWGKLAKAADGKGTYGDEGAAGMMLKAERGWDRDHSIVGSDPYGFSALPGGYRENDGGFIYAGMSGFWWTATEDGSSNAYNRNIFYYGENVNEKSFDRGLGFSARCVK